MTIIFASDHAGYTLKQKLMAWTAQKRGMTCIDVGAVTLDRDDDYPLFAHAGSRAVLDTPGAMGIFMCGSGVGMAIVANRHKGIRAAYAESVSMVRSARTDDDINVLVLGGRRVKIAQAKKIVDVFLHTRASQEKRHVRRREQIERMR